MVAVEALQDPFFHMYTLASDEENFKSLDVSVFLSCIKITMTQLQISRQNLNGFFSDISRQMML